MKISPLPSMGIAGVSLSNQAPVQDNASQAPVDAQVEKVRDSIRRIKMRTQRTTFRDVASPEGPAQTIEQPSKVTDTAPEAQTGAIADESVQTNVATEETKPLSPQLVALAKQRRALQVKERELLDREKAFEAKGTQDGTEALVSRLKSQPMSVLQEYGVTYDQLTEAILSDQSGINPKILELEAKIKSLEEGVNKNFTERDSAAEKQVLSELSREASLLVKDGDAFELVRENNRTKDAVELIHRTWKQTGEVLDVTEALQLVEDELLKDAIKIASLNKIKSKLTNAEQAPQQQKPQGIRTLTNRDSASLPMSRKERAMMAMNGTLKRG